MVSEFGCGQSLGLSSFVSWAVGCDTRRPRLIVLEELACFDPLETSTERNWLYLLLWLFLLSRNLFGRTLSDPSLV